MNCMHPSLRLHSFVGSEIYTFCFEASLLVTVALFWRQNLNAELYITDDVDLEA